MATSNFEFISSMVNNGILEFENLQYPLSQDNNISDNAMWLIDFELDDLYECTSLDEFNTIKTDIIDTIKNNWSIICSMPEFNKFCSDKNISTIYGFNNTQNIDLNLPNIISITCTFDENWSFIIKINKDFDYISQKLADIGIHQKVDYISQQISLKIKELFGDDDNSIKQINYNLNDYYITCINNNHNENTTNIMINNCLHNPFRINVRDIPDTDAKYITYNEFIAKINELILLL